ncbi:hypothetical protein WJX72_009962 [[Myrmecia] bisecta]|uniref:USP domain-containing protein n=1 Tax=[Myrmecia] bisecta TaxID=41462 RepID=A0AAW1PKT5_9CHLO
MLPETVRERLKRVEAHIQDEQGKRMARLVKQMSKRDPSGDLEKKLAEQREKEEKEKEAAERAEPRGRELQLRRRALAKSKEEAEKQQAAAVEVKAFLKAKLQEATRGVPAEQAVGAQMAVLQRLTELSWDSVVAAAPTSSEREVELRRWVAQHGCCVSFVDTLRMLGAPGQRSVTRGDDSPGITAFDSAEGLLAHWRTCLPLENRETEPSPEAEASAANLLWQVHDNQSCAWPHALPQRLTPLPPEQCRRLAAGDAPAAATGQLLPPHNQPPSWSAVLKRMRDEEGQYGHMGLPVDMVLRKMHEDLERRRTADVMKMLRSMSGDEEPGSELLASFASPITYYNLRVFQGMADLEDDGKECKIYQQAGKAYRVWNSDGNPRLAVVQLRYMKYRGSLLLWLIKELRQRNYGLCSLLFSQIKLPNDKIRTNSEEMTELFKRRHHAVRDVDLLDLASNEEEATTYWAGGPDPIIFPGRDQVPEAAHGGAAAESGDGGVNGPGAAAEAGPAPATGDVPDTQANGSHGCPAQQLKRAQQRPSVDIADLEEDFDSEDEQLVRVFLDALGTAPDEDAERRSRADHELRQVYLSDILLCLQELHASNLLTSSAMLVVGQVLAQALPGRRVEDICLQDIEALGCDELRQLLVGLHTMLGLRCRLLRSCQQMESIAASMKPQMRVRDGKVSLTRTALEHELHEALEVAQQAQQGQHGSSSKAGAAAKQPSKAGSAPVQTLKVEAWLGDAGQAAFVDALYLAPAGTEPAKAGARENGALQSTAEEGVAARLKCAQRLLVEGALHAEARTAYLAACRRTFQACMQFRAFTSFFKAASNGRLDLVDCTFALLQDGIDAVSELQLLRTKTTAKTLRAKEHRVQQRIHKLQAELERWEQQLLSQDDSLSSSADWRERQLREAAVKRQRRILQGLKEEMDINNAGLDGSGQQLFQLSKGTGVEWSQVQNVCQNVAEALENGREVEALVVMGGSFAPGSRLVVALQAALLEHVTGALDAAHQHALSVDIAQIAARKAVMDAVWMSCRDLGTELRPAFRSVLTQQLSQAARQEQAARAKAIEDELMNDPAKAAPKGFAETKKAAKGKAKKKDKAAKAAEEDRLRRERETKEEEEREAEEDKRREEEAKAERLRKEQEDMQAQHAALMEMQADEARKAAAQQAQAEAEARQQAELQCRQAEQAERKAAQQAAADREERKQAERQERILLGRIDMGDFVVPFPAQFASVQAYVKSLPEPQRAEWKMHSVLQRKQDFADLVDDCRAELSDEFIKFLAQRHHLPLPEYDPTLPSEVTESLRKPANIRRSDPKPPSDASSRGDSRASTREQDERPSTPSGQNSQHSAEGMHSPAFRNRRGRTAVTCEADPAVAGPVQGVWAQRLKQRAVEPEAASRPPPQRTGEAQPVPVLAGDEDLQVEAAIKASLAEVQQRQAQAYASAARPKPQAKQQSVAGPVAAPGLQNAAGEYNCFLNVIIQCLWHCSDFRDRLMHWEPQLVQADRVVAALVELFQAFAETEGERLRPNRLHMVHQVVAPTALREALSVLPGQNFRLGEMSDAAEVLGALYESIKGVLSSGRPLGAKLVDETFGLQVSESVHCGKCDKESQSNKYTQYFYNVAAASLRLQKAVAEAGESFGSMLREIEQNMQKSCDKDTGGCGDLLRVRHFLNNMPAIFTMQLIWESQQESSDDILLTLHALSESVDMGAIYQGLPPATHLFKLRSMVCFYGAHYHAFVFSKETRKWLMFDDATVAVVGLWPDVVRKCQLGKIQPSVLFFEKAH